MLSNPKIPSLLTHILLFSQSPSSSSPSKISHKLHLQSSSMKPHWIRVSSHAHAQRDEFEDMLHALTLERSQINDAIGSSLDNADAVGEECYSSHTW